MTARSVSINFPPIHYFDNEFVSLYEKTWYWISESWRYYKSHSCFPSKLFVHPEAEVLNQFETIMSTFFLVYSNGSCPCSSQLDVFYQKQEESGAIRSDYSLEDGSPVVVDSTNPDCLNPPLFSWAEYNIYHKIGNKKRIDEVLPILEKYYMWLEQTFMQSNGLYVAPLSATTMRNSPREKAYYLVDYNCQQALNASYIADLGDIINDKSIAFRYKQRYFALKTRINSMMWNEKLGIYCDLDKEENKLPEKTIAGFWSLLAGVPDTSKMQRLVDLLTDKRYFGVDNPVPSLSADHKLFSIDGNGYCGSVFSPFTFIIAKGLQRYDLYDFARELVIQHLYHIVGTLHKKGADESDIWEAYAPTGSYKKAQWDENDSFPRRRLLAYTGVATVTMLIEMVIGMNISLPRKTIHWVLSNYEVMGIENLMLRRNTVTILMRKAVKGWEIFHESKKLYYFTIEAPGKMRTLPIPSGRCTILVSKI